MVVQVPILPLIIIVIVVRDPVTEPAVLRVSAFTVPRVVHVDRIREAVDRALVCILNVSTQVVTVLLAVLGVTATVCVLDLVEELSLPALRVIAVLLSVLDPVAVPANALALAVKVEVFWLLLAVNDVEARFLDGLQLTAAKLLLTPAIDLAVTAIGPVVAHVVTASLRAVAVPVFVLEVWVEVAINCLQVSRCPSPHRDANGEAQ